MNLVPYPTYVHSKLTLPPILFAKRNETVNPNPMPFCIIFSFDNFILPNSLNSSPLWSVSIPIPESSTLILRYERLVFYLRFTNEEDFNYESVRKFYFGDFEF